ncbi:hypothetical protein LP085_08620 [Achromobacter sp. MY14]|uniref:hypothetical protein n=1 Tax=unclassified Achromobacter TaxID=2626865 RepID=UPI001E5E3908|nr:hypothetical protein [Achromobacter sp. MY14]MCD0496907.1 hypothetical protein [Achromobacter sp. MY14]
MTDELENLRMQLLNAKTAHADAVDAALDAVDIGLGLTTQRLSVVEATDQLKEVLAAIKKTWKTMEGENDSGK